MRKDGNSLKIRLQVYMLAIRQRFRLFASTTCGKLALSVVVSLFLFSIFLLPSAIEPADSIPRIPSLASSEEKSEPILKSVLANLRKSSTYISQEELAKLKDDPKFAQLNQRTRLILLSDGDGKINTGVWPGWGGRFPYQSTLHWGTAGLVVEKTCPVSCETTHDNSRFFEADMVVTEMINYPKFGHKSLPPPPGRSVKNARYSLTQRTGYPYYRVPVPQTLPAHVVFYYEPENYDPDFTLLSRDVASNFDFSATQRHTSTVPITLTCNWGKSVTDFLGAPPAKDEEKFIMYLSEHGVSKEYQALVDELFVAAEQDRHADIHAYRHKRNRQLPHTLQGEEYTLARMLDFMSEYKFILITDPVVENDFVSPEFSQAIAAGVVPVYLGAKNIHRYAPGPGSFVDGRRFQSGHELWDYLRQFSTLGFRENAGGLSETEKSEVREAYAQFFAWKKYASEEHRRDTKGQNLPFGAARGHFLDRLRMEPRDIEIALEYWPTPDPFDFGVLEADTEEFQSLSHNAWNMYRTNLDYCVHYAECRLCELAHSVT